MHDIFDDKEKELKGWHVKRMFLSPSQWNKCKLPVELEWKHIKFTEENKKLVPDELHGIYTFVAKPDIAKLRNKRLKALGNAIVPAVAYQIFRAILSADNKLAA